MAGDFLAEPLLQRQLELALEARLAHREFLLLLIKDLAEFLGFLAQAGLHQRRQLLLVQLALAIQVLLDHGHAELLLLQGINLVAQAVALRLRRLELAQQLGILGLEDVDLLLVQEAEPGNGFVLVIFEGGNAQLLLAETGQHLLALLLPLGRRCRGLHPDRGFLGQHRKIAVIHRRRCCRHDWLPALRPEAETAAGALGFLLDLDKGALRGTDIGIPEPGGMPGNGALAATDQVDGPGPEVRTSPRDLRHVPQRQVPAAVGKAGIIEGNREKYDGADLQGLVELHIGRPLFVAGIDLQADITVQRGLEVREHHALVDVLPIPEEHQLGGSQRGFDHDGVRSSRKTLMNAR